MRGYMNQSVDSAAFLGFPLTHPTCTAPTFPSLSDWYDELSNVESYDDLTTLIYMVMKGTITSK